MTAVLRNDPRAAVLQKLFEGALAEGRTQALLEVLSARGIDVPDEVRGTIMSCTDLDQLRAWIRRASTATTVKDLLE